MNAEKQRLAIAEVCGWKMFCKEAIDGNWGTKDKWITAPDGTSQFRHDIPDFLNDLNAMHESEGVLNQDEGPVGSLLYGRWLDKLTNQRAWHATAAQRAEAFLRTIGKWEDE